MVGGPLKTGVAATDRRHVLLRVGLVTMLATTACAPREEELSAEFFVMGGIPVHVTAWDVGPRRFELAIEACRRRVQALEASMSVYRSNSLISRANRGEPVELDSDTSAVIRTAMSVARRTGGAFDPTVGPLVRLWQAAGRNQRVPSPETVAAARDLVGYEGIALIGGGLQRLSTSDGVLLDLGGVAKGFAADAGVEVLLAHGVDRALVEVGGDLAVHDRSPSARPFNIGIRHPEDHGRLLGRLSVARGGVVTSGSAERFMEIGGVRYGHIVDPRTGYPVDGVLSATVLAPTGAEADAWATALMVLGEAAALDLVADEPDLEAVLAVADSSQPEGFRVALSAGAAPMFTAH